MIRKEFTGMLPAAIAKFEELLSIVAEFNPQIMRGYDPASSKANFFYWGVACRIECDDIEILQVEAEEIGITPSPKKFRSGMRALQTAAEEIGITWLSDDGDIAYTADRTIADFKTFRVNGDLELMPEKEV